MDAAVHAAVAACAAAEVKGVSLHQRQPPRPGEREWLLDVMGQFAQTQGSGGGTLPAPDAALLDAKLKASFFELAAAVIRKALGRKLPDTAPAGAIASVPFSKAGRLTRCTIKRELVILADGSVAFGGSRKAGSGSFSGSGAMQPESAEPELEMINNLVGALRWSAGGAQREREIRFPGSYERDWALTALRYQRQAGKLWQHGVPVLLEHLRSPGGSGSSSRR